MIHQHRAAYELCGTPYSDFEHTEADVGLRKRLFELDARMLGECRHVFANAHNTAQRLRDVQRRPGAALYHPPPLADRLRPGRTATTCWWSADSKTVKRVDLAIRAWRMCRRRLRLVIAGDGSQRAAAGAHRGGAWRARSRESSPAASTARI